MNAATREDARSGLGPWAVAFLDLLGYRAVLAKLDPYPLPTTELEMRPYTEALDDAVRSRRRLADHFTEAIALAGKSGPPLAHFPEAMRSVVEQTRQVEFVRTDGPDHVVLACALTATPAHFPMRGLFTLLHASSMGCLRNLAAGVHRVTSTLPLRGGIDLALGVWMDDEDNLYSPAVARAYELEKCASSPRVIVGRRVVEFIDRELAAADLGTNGGVVAHNFARVMKDLLFTDADGRAALDFLGPGIVRLTKDRELGRSIAADAWAFVTAAQKHHSGDDKVANKYEWLIEYMRPRLPAWGVDT